MKNSLLAFASVAGLLASSHAAPLRSNNATAKLSGVAAWWGQGSGASLDEVCGQKSFDIVILSFMNTFFGAGGYPGMNMEGLYSPSPAQKAAGATDLLDGSSLVPAIQKCQSAGKKVFLSLGGADASSKLDSDDQGAQLADTVWNLFLGGTKDADLRPFPNVTLDGIDLGKLS